MWTVIILIVVFIIGKFLWDLKKQNEQVSKEGGMTFKYKELIYLLSKSDNRIKMEEVTPNSVVFGISNMGGSTYFILTQTFSKITTQWEVNSPVFGKHSKSWTFDEHYDQNLMYQKMNSDIGLYLEKVI